jgi:hypothetical protein
MRQLIRTHIKFVETNPPCLLQVGSPGAERVVQVPQDLGRFQDLPMVVRFMAEKDVAEKKERKGSRPQKPIETLVKDNSAAGSAISENGSTEAKAETAPDNMHGEASLRASLVDPSIAAVEEDQLEPSNWAEPKLIEHEEVLALESFDLNSKTTVWKLADTRANRASGKGRGLNRRQRDQRWHVPFSRLKLVRLYLEI